MKKIYINSSDVAACIGKNKFKNPNEIMKILYNTYIKPIDKIKNIINNNFIEETKEEKVQNVINNNPKVKTIINNLNTNTVDLKEKNESVDIIKEKINNLNINNNDKKLLKEHVNSTSNKSYGTLNEDNVFNKVKLNLFKDYKFYKKSILTIEDIEFILCGRIDGYQIDENEIILIEIKNRTNRLFYRLYDYENVQIQCYLYLMKINKAKLIENYDNKTNIIEINKDENLINNKIIPELNIFCNNFYNMINNKNVI